jgi:hypothetical protein
MSVGPSLDFAVEYVDNRPGEQLAIMASYHVQSVLAGEATPMTTVLNVLIDLLLGGSALFFLLALIAMMIAESDRDERIYQSLAFAAGAIVALGAQASKIGFATYIVHSLARARPGGAAFVTLSVAIPGGLAAAFGWYGVRLMKKSGEKARRFMAFLGMLTAIAFIEIFAQATSVKGVELGAAAIPNASFVVGLILSIVLFAPGKGDRRQPGEGWLKALVRRRFSQRFPQAASLAAEQETPRSRSWAE